MSSQEPYYLRYDDRFRRMHAQGFERWVWNPEEQAAVLAQIDEFLNKSGSVPGKTSVVEFGCGEGIVAEHLLNRGYNYLGVDISESALEKARKFTGKAGRQSFLPADIVGDLHQVPDSSRDIAIDNQCLHMLVTDADRKKYLSNIKRILKPGGKVFFRVVYREQEFTEQIVDYADWLEKIDSDYSTLHEYSAWKDGKEYTVHLPRVPSRSNNETGYRRELEAAGLRMEHFESDGWQCIMYASADR